MMIAINDWTDTYKVAARATYTHSEVVLARMDTAPEHTWIVFTRNLTRKRDQHVGIAYRNYADAYKAWQDIVTLRNHTKC